MLAVVVAGVGGEGEYQFERRKVGAPSDELHLLAQWLVQQEVEEVVMKSTAQYWKPVWGALERFWNGRGPPRCPARCICARPNPTAGRAGERTSSQTANGGSNGWWRRNWRSEERRVGKEGR